MALNANALTDLDTAKTHLEIPLADVTQDAKVERFINSASDFFERYTSRKLITQSHTEYQDGRRSNRIGLNQYPITGGPADGNTKPELFIDSGSVFQSSSAVGVSDYYVDSNEFELVLLCGKFPRGTRNIKVVYEAGLGTVLGNDLPADLVDACLDYILWKYDRQNDRRIGRTNKSKGDENVTFETSIPKSIVEVLDYYQRIEFMPPVGVLNG